MVLTRCCSLTVLFLLVVAVVSTACQEADPQGGHSYYNHDDGSTTADCGGDDVINPDIVICVPHCAGKDCGSDSCGGYCGFCDKGESCVNGLCEETGCEAQCSGKQCGNNGCGGVCGVCANDSFCDGAGQCYTPPAGCVADCTGNECGSNGCGGICGLCDYGESCESGICVVKSCTPQCTGKQCGDNGCGALCGSCAAGAFCDSAGQCYAPPTGCVPSCLNKTCGLNGCGGLCGICNSDEDCINGSCVTAPCTRQCFNKQCGPDGCGGLCDGGCSTGQICDAAGLCKTIATGCSNTGVCPNGSTCMGDVCVPNNCTVTNDCPNGYVCWGGECYFGCDSIHGCPSGQTCTDGQCVNNGGGCVSDNQCPSGYSCTGGYCVQTTCTPSCTGKTCGDDGCNGSCGTCGNGLSCVSGQCTSTPPTSKVVCFLGIGYWYNMADPTMTKHQFSTTSEYGKCWGFKSADLSSLGWAEIFVRNQGTTDLTVYFPTGSPYWLSGNSWESTIDPTVGATDGAICKPEDESAPPYFIGGNRAATVTTFCPDPPVAN